MTAAFDSRLAPALVFAALLLLAGLAALLASSPAEAQPQGRRCQTPAGWCQPPYPGPQGARCQCPTPSGWVGGTLV